MKSCAVAVGTSLVRLRASTETAPVADPAPPLPPAAQSTEKLSYPAYDVGHIPFSRGGSFLTVSRPLHAMTPLVLSTKRTSALSLKWMKHWANNYYEIVVARNGRELAYRVLASPWRLRLDTGEGTADVTFVDEDTLHFHSEGLDVLLRPILPIDYHFADPRGGYCCYMFNGFSTHHVRARSGTSLAIETGTGPYAETKAIRAAGPAVDFALTIRECEIAWTYEVEPGAVVAARAEEDFARWMARRPPAPTEFASVASTAWFVLWNLRAPASGLCTRSPVLMNKSSMAQIWGWDNCFVALAIADADPGLAYDQLLLFFDHQCPTGMLPNAINDNYLTIGFTSPPLYGWTILKLIERRGETAARPYLVNLYEPMCRAVRWWLAFRDHDGDGLCNYLHGEDSGWDNATVFDDGGSVTGVDLATYLIFDFECLARIASLLGRDDEANLWRTRGDEMLGRLLRDAVEADRLVSFRSGSRERIRSQSLQYYIPLLLGQRLPVPIRRRMIEDLREGGPFLTSHGYATESPRSAKYEPNGYWRGPIWAPSTYLLYHALIDCGERDLARDVARRYCTMCDQSPGFFENYNALTGAGQFATGFAWTSAVASLLARDLSRTADQITAFAPELPAASSP